MLSNYLLFESSFDDLSSPGDYDLPIPPRALIGGIIGGSLLASKLIAGSSLKDVWVAPYDKIAKQDKTFQGVFNNALKDQNIRSFIIGYKKDVVVGYAVSFVSGTKIKLGFFIFNSYKKKIKKSVENIVNIIIESLSGDKKINISKAKKIDFVLFIYPDNSLLPIDIKLFKKTTPTATFDL